MGSGCACGRIQKCTPLRRRLNSASHRPAELFSIPNSASTHGRMRNLRSRTGVSSGRKKDGQRVARWSGNGRYFRPESVRGTLWFLDSLEGKGRMPRRNLIDAPVRFSRREGITVQIVDIASLDADFSTYVDHGGLESCGRRKTLTGSRINRGARKEGLCERRRPGSEGRRVGAA